MRSDGAAGRRVGDSLTMATAVEKYSHGCAGGSCCVPMYILQHFLTRKWEQQDERITNQSKGIGKQTDMMRDGNSPYRDRGQRLSLCGVGRSASSWLDFSHYAFLHCVPIMSFCCTG